MAFAASDPLPGLGTDPAKNTVSGLSSGAFMATQFGVAYAKEIQGVGIVAGGPFFCSGIGGFGAERFIQNATTNCLNPVGPAPSGKAAWKEARSLAEKHEIDSTDHIARQRIYIFTGGHDTVVSPRVVEQTQLFYEAAGVPARQIRFVSFPGAGHALVTANGSDLACAANTSPNLNNCGFVQAHDILRWLYGDKLKEPAERLGGSWVSFDQTEFIREAFRQIQEKDPKRYIGLAETGHAYIPAACREKNSACRTHVVFHGCFQQEQLLGDRFYRTGGYNELADTNGIVVLYPQTVSSARNPQGCWDFWGYSSKNPAAPDFYTRRGPQMLAIDAMLRRLNSAPRSH
ncbi:extracellular catalytic domain type 2 short-chain-length polyhydroxyalkanoate depolymerase [Xylophilus rhododendri]|nr:PHB depolymerase family esterase [Xylophilus rhododendri]